ncbi:MAG: phospholipid carrier-dependent glycosyltransferase [Planctomycetota bacterium]
MAPSFWASRPGSIVRPVLASIILLGYSFAFLGTPGVVDYDEAAYAEVSRSMYASGDWVVPRLGDVEFFEKPVFLYWTHLLGYELFGVGAWGVRFFNALAAVALAVSVFLFARRGLGERAAWIAALVMVTACEPAVLARVALTDTWLALWLTLCLGLFHRADEQLRRGRSGAGPFFASCVCAGLAVLTKGAVGLVLPVAAVAAYLLVERRPWFVLRPRYLLPGAALALSVGGSWVLLVGFTHPQGFGFLAELFGEHHVDRFLSAKQGHGGSILYYVPVVLVGALPWTGALIWGVTERPWRRRGEGGRLVLLFSLLAIVALAFFSLAATKLPSYAGPVFPGIALLVGASLATARPADAGGHARAWRRVVHGTAGSFALLATAFLLLPAVLPRLPTWFAKAAAKAPGLLEPIDLGALPWITGALLAMGAVWVWRSGRKGSGTDFAIATGASFAVFVSILTQAWWPAYDDHFARPLRTMAHCAASEVPPGHRVVVLGLRHVPSISFYGGRLTRYVSAKDRAGIASLFAGPTSEIVITTEPILHDALLPAAPAGRMQILARATGYVAVRCGARS